MVKKLRKEHRIITYLNQTNDQLSTRYVLVFSSIILRVSPINVIDTNKYELFPPCNILFDTLLLRLCNRRFKRSPYGTFYLIHFYYDAYVYRSIQKVTRMYTCCVFLLYFPSTCPHLVEFDIPGIDCKRENACLQKCASKFLPIRVAILNLIGTIASNQEILNAFFLSTEAFSPLSTKSIPKNHPHFIQKA